MDAKTLDIQQEVVVSAPKERVFDALVHRFTDGNYGQEKAPMPMKMELWPGGRWYRDLGDGRGHLWGHVQSIKKGELLEFYGPLFMSFPVTNNVIIRFTEEDGKTTISFSHRGFGLIEMSHIEGLTEGWADYLATIKQDCES